MQRIARYDDPDSLGHKLRKKRMGGIVRLIEACFAETRSCRILDIGGEAYYWNLLDHDYLRSRNVRVTIVNLYAPSVAQAMNAAPDIIDAAIGDGCALSYADNEFDIAHSNSVIEHVGGWRQMVAFANETRRVAPRYFVQMPYFWFPYEPHLGGALLHWLPEPLLVSLSMRRRLGCYPKAANVGEAMLMVQEQRLLDRRAFSFLFPDGEIHREKFYGLTKSLIAIKAVASDATADLIEAPSRDAMANLVLAQAQAG